ncbi:MAG: hypothetical protein HGB10_09640 [Coriobacteriia bacterium]|nr:hypothetical protein [Coriobacteriia bacterium]
MKKPTEKVRRVLAIAGWVAGVLLVIVAALTALLVLGLRVNAPGSNPQPTATYEAALARVDALKARDGDGIIRPTIFIGQGSKVTTAVVIFHGFTNNPEQFERIGKVYADAGYNVLIPRLPEHGEGNLMTSDLSKITTERLAAAADEAIDIGAGLGDRVEVVGLSGGGTLAAWSARQRNEVTGVVVMSPLFGIKILPGFLVKPIVAWSRVLPDFYQWWDPLLREKHLPADAYPRYSIKSIGSFFDVGYGLAQAAPRQRPLERAVLITNAADMSIDARAAKRVFENQLQSIAATSTAFEFPAQDGYAHDLVDPEGLNEASIDAIYSQLYPLLGVEQPVK